LNPLQWGFLILRVFRQENFDGWNNRPPKQGFKHAKAETFQKTTDLSAGFGWAIAPLG
jgi:hypothetical protein